MSNRGKGQPKKRNTVRSDEPSPRDFEVYLCLCEGCTLREAGEKFSLSFSFVRDIRDKVEKYLAPKLEREIKQSKIRQTQLLQSLVKDNMDSWRRSRRGDAVETKDGEQGYSKTAPLGDVAYFDRVVKALADIRKIWGIEKHYEMGGIEALNPSGMSRDEYQLKVAQAQLQEAQEMIKELQQQGAAGE